MANQNNANPPILKNHIPEMPVEERIKYISDEMIYNEEELAFIRTRDEVMDRAITMMDESLARGREFLARENESLARDRELIAELDALIAKLEGKKQDK